MAPPTVSIEQATSLSKDDGPAVIVAASTSFPDNVEVQVSVFKLMNTCIQSPADQALFVEAGAIEAAAVALTRHHSDADVARAVCRILSSLMMGSIPNSERAVALGLIESVMTVFAEHCVTAQDVSLAAGRMIMGRSAPPTFVAVSACSAIMALVCGHPAHQERAGAAGACEVVVKLLQDHPRVDDVLCAAAEAVLFLIADPMSDSPKLTHRANQNRFLVAGAVAAMDAALAYPGCESPDLLKHLKGLLATPAADDA